MDNNQTNKNQPDFDNLKEQITNPQDVTNTFSQEDIAQNKIIAALASFPILFWVPVAFKGDSQFGKFYANQGLIELLLVVALNIVNGIVGGILGLIPFIGGLLAAVVALAASLIMLAAWLFLLINALNGKAKYLPLIGDLFTAFK